MQALVGTRVLDFSQVMAGPYCTRLLVEMGAEVVKVEPPGGEVVRHRSPLSGGRSRYFGQLNAGKRSVVLDLAHPDGRAAALALVRASDVLVENFRPGVMARLGLDSPTCREQNPSLVYCSISGYGHHGPRDPGRPAVAPVIHAASGYDLAVAGYQAPGSDPPATGVFVADVLAGALASSGILAALAGRELTGEGAHVDIALHDAMLSLLVEEVQVAQVEGARTAPPYRPIRARDGFVMVGIVTTRQIVALAELTGRPDIADDPRFSESGPRRAHLEELHSLVEAWTRERSTADVENAMRAAGVPCTAYRTVAEQLADDALLARGTLREAHDSAGAFTIVASPIRLAMASGGLQPAPRGAFEVRDLGADTRDVLAQAGYDATGIAQLIECGAACDAVA